MRAEADFEMNSSQPRSFGLLISLICAVVALYLALSNQPGYGALVCFGILFFLTAIFKPSTLASLTRVWILIGIKISRITNPILMGLIYFVLMFPVAIMLRVFRKDFLQLRHDKTVTSYWHNVNQKETKLTEF